MPCRPIYMASVAAMAVKFANLIKIPLMVTGGFRSRSAMRQALESGAVDLIGLGRSLCYFPDGAKRLLGGMEMLPRKENDLALFPPSLQWLTRFKNDSGAGWLRRTILVLQPALCDRQNRSPCSRTNGFSGTSRGRGTAEAMDERPAGVAWMIVSGNYLQLLALPATRSTQRPSIWSFGTSSPIRLANVGMMSTVSMPLGCSNDAIPFHQNRIGTPRS